MPESVNTLSYAIRIKVVLKYLGQLSIMLAVLTSVPMAVSIGFEEYFLTRRYLLVIAILLTFGLFASRIKHYDDLQKNESLTITAIIFLITPVLMSFPLTQGGLTFINAWFEAVSAVTTTGLSTINNLEDKPYTFLFARAWMQWYGGLGIVVLSVAILMGHHTAIKRLVGTGGESMMTTTRHYARRTLIIYAVLTFIGFLVIWWLLEDLFLALTHTLAAISTGGFSPLNGSLSSIPDWITRYAIIILCLLGALPLVLYYRLFKGSWRDVLLDQELRVLLILIAIISTLLSFTLQQKIGLPWNEALGHGFLLGISAQTTAGFVSLELNQLSSDSLVLLIVAMIIGGSAGSTAGGIKILRLIIIARLVQLVLQRSAMPNHAVTRPYIGERVLQEVEINQALLLVILYGIVIMLSWFIFLLFDYPPLQALFEVVSAMGTVGLSTGITSAELHPILKIVLCIDMLLGRLEIIALLVILFPPTWIGRRKE